jgi:uncharacterized membrane protein YczE
MINARNAINRILTDPYLRRRIGMTIVGVLTLGVSVGVVKYANFGIDPFTTLMYGLLKFVNANVAPEMTYGLLYTLVNIALLVVMCFVGKHWIGLGTLINLFLLGYVIQGTVSLLGALVPDPSLPVRIAFLVAGLASLCFASSLYYVADLGVSTYDFIALEIDEKGLMQFRTIRIITDCACVLLGLLLRSMPGIATVITALCMGPFVSFINERFSRPFLNRKKTA